MAQVIPILMTYWREKGSKNINFDQTGRSIRTFAGFLMQDRVTDGAVITDLTPALFERFREWRMGPHDFDLPWGDRREPYASQGVSGDTVQRNLNDIRAAVNHAHNNMRIPQAPRIGMIDRRYRSKHKDRVLSEDELARIVWYSYHFPDLFRFVTLQMVTSVRPTAAGQFNPRRQFDQRSGLIDLQPDEAPNTRKRNAIIPAVRPMKVIMTAWSQEEPNPVVSHKTAWRTMRKALGLSDDVHAKTIRYTIATWLYEMDWVPERQISEMLGHVNQSELARTSRIYAQYRPDKMGKVVKGLEVIWLRTSRRVREIDAGQLLVRAQWHQQYMIIPRPNKDATSAT
ncbi:MAG: integrase [Novosphingobium sp.]|nr:integrase [Novosphingobium sp.]